MQVEGATHLTNSISVLWVQVLPQFRLQEEQVMRCSLETMCCLRRTSRWEQTPCEARQDSSAWLRESELLMSWEVQQAPASCTRRIVQDGVCVHHHSSCNCSGQCRSECECVMCVSVLIVAQTTRNPSTCMWQLRPCTCPRLGPILMAAVQVECGDKCLCPTKHMPLGRMGADGACSIKHAADHIWWLLQVKRSRC